MKSSCRLSPSIRWYGLHTNHNCNTARQAAVWDVIISRPETGNRTKKGWKANAFHPFFVWIENSGQ